MSLLILDLCLHQTPKQIPSTVKIFPFCLAINTMQIQMGAICTSYILNVQTINILCMLIHFVCGMGL